MPPTLGTILLKSLGIHSLNKFIKMYPNGRAEMVRMKVRECPTGLIPKKERAVVNNYSLGEAGKETKGTKILWKIIHG